MDVCDNWWPTLPAATTPIRPDHMPGRNDTSPSCSFIPASSAAPTYHTLRLAPLWSHTGRTLSGISSARLTTGRSPCWPGIPRVPHRRRIDTARVQDTRRPAQEYPCGRISMPGSSNSTRLPGPVCADGCSHTSHLARKRQMRPAKRPALLLKIEPLTLLQVCGQRVGYIVAMPSLLTHTMRSMDAWCLN